MSVAVKLCPTVVYVKNTVIFFSGLFLTSPKCLSILNFFLLGQVDEICVEENQAETMRIR